jgi:hypothetical protein
VLLSQEVAVLLLKGGNLSQRLPQLLLPGASSCLCRLLFLFLLLLLQAAALATAQLGLLWCVEKLRVGDRDQKLRTAGPQFLPCVRTFSNFKIGIHI